MALDPETTKIIIAMVLILIFATLMLVLTRKYSKKAMRRWLSQKGEDSIDSDKAFNSLLAVRAITKNYGEKGMDVTEVELLNDHADNAIRLKNYKVALDAIERAKEKLTDLRKRHDAEIEALSGARSRPLTAKDFDFSEKGDYEPTTKEVLQRKYPPNYLQAKFSIGLTERLRSDAGPDCPDLKEVDDLICRSRALFDGEDYDGALSCSLKCKKLLEARGGVQPPAPDSGGGPACPRCGQAGRPGDGFCRRCGNGLNA